jgi:hypothetical protein
MRLAALFVDAIAGIFLSVCCRDRRPIGCVVGNARFYSLPIWRAGLLEMPGMADNVIVANSASGSTSARHAGRMTSFGETNGYSLHRAPP